jgi:hypothetical protein
MPQAETFSVTAAAALAGLPRGTLAAWRHRGHAPAGGEGGALADVLGLALAAELVRVGLRPAAARAVARAARGAWGRVLAARQPLGARRLILVARRDDPGSGPGADPASAGGGWVAEVFEAGSLPPPAAVPVLQVDLGAVARGVLARLAEVRV